MVNIYEILQRAASLKEETVLNSISPERAGGIMYDTLLALNDLWLQQGSALVISKIYESVAAMEADTAPVSDLTGKPLRPGQIVVIASSDSDNGSVYRYNGTDAPSWSLVGAIGNLTPVDSLDSDSTTLPLAANQGKVLDGKISQLGQDVNGSVFVKANNLKINKFFKELYIEPVYLNEFDLSSVKAISVYRNKHYSTYNRWLIQFTSENQDNLCSFDVQENPESEDIIYLVAASSHQRFNAKAVVDWSQLEDGENLYLIEGSLTELCLDLKYSSYLNYKLKALDIINNGYKFKGIIDTNPSLTIVPAPKTNEFYIATAPGTYPNIGNLELPYGKLGFLKYDNQWTIETIDLLQYFGKIVAFDGTISKTEAGTSWESIRRFYNRFYSLGEKAKLKIENNTGSGFNCLVGLYGRTTQTIRVSASATELNIDYGYGIKQLFLYFSADDSPEGTLKITVSCNNYCYIEELSNKINDISLHQTRKATGNVSVGGNLLVKVFGDYKTGETYIINISGTVDSTLLLRGIKKEDGSTVELGNIRCNNYCRKTFAYDYSEIRVALNNMRESGSVTLSVLSDDAWSSINDNNNIRVKSCGLINTKTFFKSGFDCYAEILGNFKANKEYQIELSGDAGSNSFYLMLFSLENTEIYRTSGFVTGRTYIFKCPYDAEKIVFIRNNISSDVELHVVIKEATVAKIEKQMPNYIGIPIAAHQGNTAGGQTIGSPKAWLAAQRLGYKWIECDIQFTSDNIAVFLHDLPINYRGNSVVRKDNRVPISPSDNITVDSLTYRQLKDTYRWSDGGEILSLVEGFGLLSMLGMNCVLEFKAYADNDEKREYLKTACLIFGIERIIYNATSTDYRIIFPTLVNLDIYRRGNISLTSSDESDMEAAFAYASQLGNAVVSCYALQGGIDSDFAQRMIEKYGVAYVGKWGKNTKYQTGLIISDDIAPVKDSYSNKSDLLSNQDVNYADDYISVGTVAISELSNVNLSMIADENISVKIQTKNYEYYGNVNIACILPSGVYNVYIKGTGHIAELSIRY